MSRVKERNALKIMLTQTEYNGQKGFYINNVVFKEVFNNLNINTSIKKPTSITKKIINKYNKIRKNIYN